MDFIPAVLPSELRLRRSVEENLARLLRLADAEDVVVAEGLWKRSGESNGVKCFVPTDSFPAARGDAFVPFPRAAIMDLLLDVAKKGETDSQFETGHVVERLDDYHTSISYMRFKGLGFVAGRDFCNLTHWCVREDGIVLIAAWGWEHPACPEVKGAVRGELQLGGWVLRPVFSSDGAEEGCEASYCMRSDFKGSIPGWVTRQVAAQQATIVGVVNKVLKAKWGDAKGFMAHLQSSPLPAYVANAHNAAIVNVNPAHSAAIASAAAAAAAAEAEAAAAAAAAKAAASVPTPAKKEEASQLAPAAQQEKPVAATPVPVVLQPPAPATPAQVPQQKTATPQPQAVEPVKSAAASTPAPTPAAAKLPSPAPAPVSVLKRATPQKQQPAPGAATPAQQAKTPVVATAEALSTTAGQGSQFVLFPVPSTLSSSSLFSNGAAATAGALSAPDAFISTDELGGSPAAGLAFRTELPPCPAPPAPGAASDEGYAAWLVAESAASYCTSLLSSSLPSLLRRSEQWDCQPSLLLDPSNPTVQVHVTASMNAPAAPLTLLNCLLDNGLVSRLLHDSAHELDAMPASRGTTSMTVPQSFGPQYELLTERFLCSSGLDKPLVYGSVVRHYRVVKMQGSRAGHAILLVRAPIISSHSGHDSDLSSGDEHPLYAEAFLIAPGQVTQSSPASTSTSTSTVIQLLCIFPPRVATTLSASGSRRRDSPSSASVASCAALQRYWSVSASQTLQPLSTLLRSACISQGNMLWRHSKRQQASKAVHSRVQLKGLPLRQLLEGFFSPFGLVEAAIDPRPMPLAAPAPSSRAGDGASNGSTATQKTAPTKDPSLAHASGCVGALIASALPLWIARVSPNLTYVHGVLLCLLFVLLLFRAPSIVYPLLEKCAKPSSATAGSIANTGNAEAPSGSASASAVQTVEADILPLVSLLHHSADSSSTFLPAGLPTLVAKAAALALARAKAVRATALKNGKAAEQPPVSACIIAKGGVMIHLPRLSAQSLLEASIQGASGAVVMSSSQSVPPSEVAVLTSPSASGGDGLDFAGASVRVTLDNCDALLRGLHHEERDPSSSSRGSLRSTRHLMLHLRDHRVKLSVALGGDNARSDQGAFLEAFAALLASPSSLSMQSGDDGRADE